MDRRVTDVSRTLRVARSEHANGDLAAAAERARVVEDLVDSAETDDVRADITHRLASYFRDTGDPARAELHARRAIAERRAVGATPDILLGNHLMFLSQILQGSGRRDEALACTTEALQHYIDSPGETHGEVRYILGVIAALRRR